MGSKASVKSKSKIGVKMPMSTPDTVESPKMCSLLPVEPYQQPTDGSICIHDLPDEILDHVFTFLTIKERIRTEWVCLSWAEFGKNYKWSWPTKLTDEMIMHDVNAITDEIRSSVMSRCGITLKRLQMKVRFAESNASPYVFNVIGSSCPNLTEIMLDLGNSEVMLDWDEKPKKDENVDWSLINVTKGCPKLKKISIRLLNYLGNEHFANVWLALKDCRSLEYLEIYSNKVIDEECLDSIKVALKGLDLWIDYCSNFVLIAKTLLTRSDPIEELGFGSLKDGSYACLVKVFHHYEETLKVLSLHSCGISSDNLCGIPVMLTHLEVLSLKSSYSVDNQVINVLAANCKNLWALNISETKVTDVGISALAALPYLTCLDVSRTQIAGNGLQELASHGRLEMVYFAGLLYPDREKVNLIQQSCVELVNGSPNLRLLDLRFNYGVTDIRGVVEELRSCLQRGVIKGPVMLHLSKSQVRNEIEVCDKLELAFDSRHVFHRCGRDIHGVLVGTYEHVVPASTSAAGRIIPWGREVSIGWG